MNLLAEQLPEVVEVDGVEYPLNVNFRDAIRTILAFEDSSLTIAEKYSVLLTNLFGESVPADRSKAIALALRFLNGGEDSDEEVTNSPRLYSFEKDSNYIFAAFRQTHGIDLAAETNLHWWKFLALFMDLGSDTVFCGLIAFRRRILDGTASKEEKKEYQRNRELYDVEQPDTRTVSEKMQEQKFLQLVEQRRKERANAGK